MNNADLIVKTMKEAGVTHCFGIPSGNVLPMLEAMRKGGITFVLTAHEGSASFAADVMGRLTGAPGFCIATLGPGATNLSTGVGNAYLDRSPLIALTCNLHTHQLGRRIQMYIDHHTLYRPISKASLPLRKGRVAAVLEEAMGLALSEPHGPVHLDLPEDVSLARPPQKNCRRFLRESATGQRPRARSGNWNHCYKAPSGPSQVFGSTSMRMENPALLRDFIDRHQLPFATTTMAKGDDRRGPPAIGRLHRTQESGRCSASS